MSPTDDRNDPVNNSPFDPDGDLPIDPELLELLENPSMWEEPSADLATKVSAAVAHEVSALRGAAGSDRPASSPASPFQRSPEQRPTSATPGPTAPPKAPPTARPRPKWLTGAVAAAAIVVVGTVGAVLSQNRPDKAPTTVMALAATDLEPAAQGTARITPTESGLRIELDATGLPRRDGNNFYQAWLKGPSGLVPIGTFHTGEKVTLWAGVALKDFPTLTVTQEEVGDQASSGKKVLVGTVTTTP